MTKKNDRRPGKDTDTKKTFSQYATYYDILYQDKDYTKEALFISQLINEEFTINNHDIRVLDVACGTGRHAIELSKLGYNVSGSDQSEEMIERAIKESEMRNLDIKFYKESFQTIGRISEKYKVILSMFSAIDYLTSYDDISIAFQNIYSLLQDDGILIFDFWNGNAVIDRFSPVRVKRVNKDGIEIIRISETTINRISQLATVKFHFMVIDNNRLLKEFDEEHIIRYFFLQEMIDLLQANHLKVIARCPFLDIKGEVVATDWNVTYVVRKVNDNQSVIQR